jgi:hypothetical protein
MRNAEFNCLIGKVRFLVAPSFKRAAEAVHRDVGAPHVLEQLEHCHIAHRSTAFAPRKDEAIVPKAHRIRTTQKADFRRVLRSGRRAAVSVNTVVERSYNHQINVIIGRYVPSLTEAVTRTFALGDASRMQSLFADAGFVDVETHTVKHTFVLPSFDAYYGPFERGGASTGQALASLPDEIRKAVREVTAVFRRQRRPNRIGDRISHCQRSTLKASPNTSRQTSSSVSREKP